MTARAFSLRQPLAWLVASGKVDLINVGWFTAYRGPALVHAANARIQDLEWLRGWWKRRHGIELPEAFERGGFIGTIEIAGIVRTSKSRFWQEGPWGIELRGAKIMPIVPYVARSGLFPVTGIYGTMLTRAEIGASH